MTDQELAALKERRAALDARQKQAREQRLQLLGQAQTLDEQRTRDKATCAELDAKIQAEERERAAKLAPRRPHPEKPGVVVETVEVEKPVTVGRALKKLFTGR